MTEPIEADNDVRATSRRHFLCESCALLGAAVLGWAEPFWQVVYPQAKNA
jgi:hypothetical protein